ncbi:hypothetical protein J6590_023948, partial [Homalodisca vitripennis]
KLRMDAEKLIIDALEKYDAQRIQKGEIEAQEQNKNKKVTLNKKKKDEEEDYWPEKLHWGEK